VAVISLLKYTLKNDANTLQLRGVRFAFLHHVKHNNYKGATAQERRVRK
jgi:hypothetical protein